MTAGERGSGGGGGSGSLRINIGPSISYGRGASLANRLCAPALMLPPSSPPPISLCIGGERGAWRWGRQGLRGEGPVRYNAIFA